MFKKKYLVDRIIIPFNEINKAIVLKYLQEKNYKKRKVNIYRHKKYDRYIEIGFNATYIVFDFWSKGRFGELLSTVELNSENEENSHDKNQVDIFLEHLKGSNNSIEFKHGYIFKSAISDTFILIVCILSLFLITVLLALLSRILPQS